MKKPIFFYQSILLIFTITVLSFINLISCSSTKAIRLNNNNIVKLDDAKVLPREMAFRYISPYFSSAKPNLFEVCCGRDCRICKYGELYLEVIKFEGATKFPYMLKVKAGTCYEKSFRFASQHFDVLKKIATSLVVLGVNY